MKLLQSITAAGILLVSTSAMAAWGPFSKNNNHSGNNNWGGDGYNNAISDMMGDMMGDMQMDMDFSFKMKARGNGRGRGNGSNYWNGYSIHLC